MSTKKIMLLGSMALALVALAVPASASAVHVTDQGKEVHNKTFELTSTTTAGGVVDKTKFEALGSGIECVIHVVVKVDTTTITVQSFTVTTSTCASFGNPYSNCEIETDEPTPATFAVSVDATQFTITAGKIDGNLKTKPGAPEPCFTTQNDITVGSKGVTMTPDSVSAIKVLTLGGELRVDTALNPNPGSKATAVGALEVVGADAGTYEIK